MKPVEICAVLKYNILRVHFCESSPSYSTIKAWVANFKCACQDTEDAPYSGRPKTITTTAIVEKDHEFVLNEVDGR